MADRQKATKYPPLQFYEKKLGEGGIGEIDKMNKVDKTDKL